MPSGLNIAFAGTPEFAASLLSSLINGRNHQISMIYTRPDKPSGRGRKIRKSPVKELAELHGLPVRQPENRQQLQQETGLDRIDVLIVAAYGMLIPADVLKRPRFGCINVHTSLLPRWRGAAPVQRAILAGDQETGITIMQMDAGLDTGDILQQKSCPILQTDTTGSLFEKMAFIGSECLHNTLHELLAGTVYPLPQPDDGVTYAHKISKDEASIEWNTPAGMIDRQIRAFNPSPIASATLAGQSVRIWQAQVLKELPDGRRAPGSILAYSPAGLDVATSDYPLRILRLQLPGKKVLDCRDFYNGNPHFGSAR